MADIKIQKQGDTWRAEWQRGGILFVGNGETDIEAIRNVKLKATQGKVTPRQAKPPIAPMVAKEVIPKASEPKVAKKKAAKKAAKKVSKKAAKKVSKKVGGK